MVSKIKTLVIVSGKISSGKDTIADYLINKYNFQKIGFADQLKEITSYLFDVNVGNHVGVSLSKRERTVLQKMGTFGRMIDSNVWINLLLKELDNTTISRIVIKDARFPNEIKAINKYCIDRNIHLITIRINHYPKVLNFSLLKKSLSKLKCSLPLLGPNFHASEIALDAYNNWNLEFNRRKNTTIRETLNAVDNALKGKLNVLSKP